MSIGQLLISKTMLTAEQLDDALQFQQTCNPRLEIGQILIDKGYVTPLDITRAIAGQWNLSYITTIKNEQIRQEWIKKFPLDYLKKQCVIPLEDENKKLIVAIGNPLNVEAYDAVVSRIGQYGQRVVCPSNEIEQAISRCYYHGIDNKEGTSLSQNSVNGESKSMHEDLLNIADQAPIVKVVNTILFQAIQRRASDIHIEPYENEVKVRFRIDGVLHDVFTPPHHQVHELISRLKIMASLNIAERRLPQDGQSRVKIGTKEMDIRVSIVPTAGGERVVLRLLDKGTVGLTLKDIGFSSDTQAKFTRHISEPHGIILLTGPTGSGKTTTLYCAINELNTHERNILTVEDPIEYQLPGIGQMQVKPKIDLTFANCLRHILRQDPDVIMIGEIRDVETAEIAVHASLTGHMVLSTLHTNDSASSVSRLVDMGIEPYLISSSLTAVMAQRLVRVICPHCKTACKTEQDWSSLKSDYNAQRDNHRYQFYVGSGCEHCYETGYHGRTGIFELLEIDETIKELITRKAPAHIIKKTAMHNKMRTLRDDGLRLAIDGVTTLEEVLRVTQQRVALDLRTDEHVAS